MTVKRRSVTNQQLLLSVLVAVLSLLTVVIPTQPASASPATSETTASRNLPILADPEGPEVPPEKPEEPGEGDEKGLIEQMYDAIKSAMEHRSAMKQESRQTELAEQELETVRTQAAIEAFKQYRDNPDGFIVKGKAKFDEGSKTVGGAGTIGGPGGKKVGVEGKLETPRGEIEFEFTPKDEDGVQNRALRRPITRTVSFGQSRVSVRLFLDGRSSVNVRIGHNALAAHRYQIEQAILDVANKSVELIPRYCFVNPNVATSQLRIDRSKCKAYAPAWQAITAIANRPRFCEVRVNRASCANGVADSFERGKPAFGKFFCKRTKKAYWSNGGTAYTQITGGELEACPTVRRMAFHGKYKPKTGANARPRNLKPSDCPNETTEQGEAKCSGELEPPSGNYGCIQHERNNLWKCPGDSYYFRPKPVDTKYTPPRPRQGAFTCGANGDRYWANDQNQYMQINAKTRNVDQELCRGVEYTFHMYCQGRVFRTINPGHQGTLTCPDNPNPIPHPVANPPKGNFVCVSNDITYYSNGIGHYMQLGAEKRNITQWLCPGVKDSFHVYCNGKVVRGVAPHQAQKQTC